MVINKRVPKHDSTIKCYGTRFIVLVYCFGLLFWFIVLVLLLSGKT